MTTSQTGMDKSRLSYGSAAFSLVELILVMALLVIVMAVSAPSLARSMRQRHLSDEAARFVALTEYSRNEAVSQGVPMTVWIDPAGGRCGVEAKVGFTGSEARAREFKVGADIQFELENAVASRGVVDVVEFGPEGAPSPGSIDTLRVVDRFDSAIAIAKTSDGWSYEVVKETR